MIYLEYDDGHNSPIIYDYPSRDECIRRVIGKRPSLEGGRPFSLGPYRADNLAWGCTSVEEMLARDQKEWDDDLATLDSLICDPNEDRAEWEASIHCDTYRRVNAKEMERRARKAAAAAKAMKKGKPIS